MIQHQAAPPITLFYSQSLNFFLFFEFEKTVAVKYFHLGLSLASGAPAILAQCG